MVIDKLPKLKKCIFFFLLLFFVVPKLSYSQNDFSIDDYSFVCKNSIKLIEERLLSGTRAFLIEIEKLEGDYIINTSAEQKDLEVFLDEIKTFIQENDQVIISLVFKGNSNTDALKKILEAKFFEKILFHREIDWPKISSLKENGVQVIAVFESNLATTSIEQIRKENKYLRRFSSDPLNKLILFNSLAKSDSTLYKEAFELWKNTGKVPNFIIAPNIKEANLKRVVDSLNRTRRFRGVLEYNGEKLSEISWTNSSKIITPAKFSFPLTELEMILSPYKNGYRITPAEVIHHKGQSDAPRVFSAFDVVIKDNLVYDFSFDNKIENAMETEWDRAISKNVSFINDPERGNVLHLNTFDSFVDYSKENTLDFKTPISVSVWIRPDRIPHFMGILGFGMAFSVKLREGSPDFTMATVKDHIVEHPLEINKWHHLVVVYNPKTTIDFYLNGKKIGETDSHNIIPSKQPLVIGNNIWGEQFFGTIDDLKIWDRGLSIREVKALFNENQSGGNYTRYISLGIFILLGLCFVLLFKRNKKTVKKERTSLHVSNKNCDNSEKSMLHLFGSFKIDLVPNKILSPSFSPLHRQLLSFFILSTIDEKDGVNTARLTETFWPGVSKMKAKENRNGNIRKLRKVLSQIDGLEVVFEDKKWCVKTSQNFEVDLFQYIELKEELVVKLDKGEVVITQLQQFLKLLKKGNIMQNMQTEWADYFKNKISNEVENLLSKVYDSQGKQLHSALNIKIAKTILLFDSLNENALKILITELASSGKHGLAKNAYLTFSKNYKALYGESFGFDYQYFVEK